MLLEKERLERIQREGECDLLVYIFWDIETFSG